MKLPQAGETHRRMTETDWGLRKPIAASRVPDQDAIVVASQGKLSLFTGKDRKLELQKEVDQIGRAHV